MKNNPHYVGCLSLVELDAGFSTALATDARSYVASKAVLVCPISRLPTGSVFSERFIGRVEREEFGRYRAGDGGLHGLGRREAFERERSIHRS
jgi:hypothetical protein